MYHPVQNLGTVKDSLRIGRRKWLKIMHVHVNFVKQCENLEISIVGQEEQVSTVERQGVVVNNIGGLVAEDGLVFPYTKSNLVIDNSEDSLDLMGANGAPVTLGLKPLQIDGVEIKQSDVSSCPIRDLQLLKFNSSRRLVSDTKFEDDDILVLKLFNIIKDYDIDPELAMPIKSLRKKKRKKATKLLAILGQKPNFFY